MIDRKRSSLAHFTRSCSLVVVVFINRKFPLIIVSRSINWIFLIYLICWASEPLDCYQSTFYVCARVRRGEDCDTAMNNQVVVRILMSEVIFIVSTESLSFIAFYH